MTIIIPTEALLTIALLVAALLLRLLLDFRLAQFTVRWLSWLPTRFIYLDKVTDLRGHWGHQWDGDVGRFTDPLDRHGQHQMYQFFRWCFAVTVSGNRFFAAFGKIEGEYLTGTWYDTGDSIGYFGAFHLRIVNGQELIGSWIGHSKSQAIIRNGTWSWLKIGG
jgi:hypothetical protein